MCQANKIYKFIKFESIFLNMQNQPHQSQSSIPPQQSTTTQPQTTQKQKQPNQPQINSTQNPPTLQKNHVDISKQNDWYGINKTLYINSKPQIPIKTGLDYQLLPKSPQFNQNEGQGHLVYEPKPYRLEEAIKKDIQIICFLNQLMNKIVYDYNQPPLSKDLNPKDYGVDMLPFYVPTSPQDKTLVFQSRFQSGNLRRVIQLTQTDYQLILRPDWKTNSHTQWYYFSVANTRKDVQYKFMIINLMKCDSLYNSGMMPLLYSQKQAKINNVGFYRDGYDICYYQNNLKRKNGDFFYTLCFTLKFKHDFDTVYIAHCYPYTYTKLQLFLRQIQTDPKRKHLVQRKTLCQTIAQNNCDYVIISDFNNGKQKKGVFLTSRVHPGQSMASFVIQYMIQFLLGNSSVAKILRQNFIFKIVPMLNVDGVIVGNYRCNLAQADLNRQWIDPSKKNHPTIYHAKQLIKRMKQQRDLLVYCDFHGHSRKKNCFMYGCSKDGSKKEQIFPAIVRTNCDTFSFNDCCFLLQKDRQGASRIALWKQFGITNCYTFQISFCGADTGKYEYKHFNLQNYRKMAQGFCYTIYDYFEPQQTKVTQAISDLQQNILKYEKFDDADSGTGSDQDDKKQAKVPTKQQNSKQSQSQNKVIIKTKPNQQNLSLKKKK